MTSSSNTDVLIATGANQSYWRCLNQFLGNIEKQGLNRGLRIIAYDLGLEAPTLARLKARYPWCEFRRFRFEDYPPHVAMAVGSYAFKPLIVTQLMEDAQGPVFWFDSATLFHTRDLSFLIENVRRNGVSILLGQTKLQNRCDPDVLARLEVPFFIRRKPELAAGAIGFDASAPHVRALVREWAGHALVKDHIVPRTPRLALHRPDQALLTWLVYREEASGVLRLTGEEIDISSAAPVRWMSSRNVIPAKSIWSDWLWRLYYRIYKRVDRTLWRFKQLQTSGLDGLHRRLKEHFSVLLRDAKGKTWRLRPPSWCYFADPFLVSHEGKGALLVERFDYRRCKGELCAMALDANLRPGPAIPILRHYGHASFPFTFSHQGHLYLVPETCQDRSIGIHRCEVFPHTWHRVRSILDDIDAVDSVIFARDGYWWLITAVRDGASRHLEIYFTDDPLKGEWRPHPVNAARLYHDLPCSSGRNGGAVIEQDGLLLRPAQSSRRYYGEGLRLMRIEALTPTEYREVPYDGPHPLAALIEDFSPHHLSADGGVVAFDIRDRARGGEGLWSFSLKRRPRPEGDIPIPPLRAKVGPPEAEP